MAPLYYKGSQAAVLVYDVMSLESFDEIRGWVEGSCAFGACVCVCVCGGGGRWGDLPCPHVHADLAPHVHESYSHQGLHGGLIELRTNCPEDLVLCVVGNKADTRHPGEGVDTTVRLPTYAFFIN